MKKLYIIFVFIQFITLATKAQSPAQTVEHARVFVQNFYDWYTVLYNTRANKNSTATADIVALNKKASYFDPQLRKAIIADANAQANVRGEIVGFDSDPFLNAQDDGFTYLTGNVKQVGSSFFIDLHAGLTGKSKMAILNSEVVVIAEVANVNGAWRFKNFFYPYKGKKKGLLEMLNSLHNDRVKEGYEKP